MADFLLGGTYPTNIRLGNSAVSKIMHGSIQVWPRILDIPIKYGYLYNWWAATDVRNITASGWHVPSSAEFGTLIIYLGGTSIAGGKIKETGLTYWNTPNTSATNEVGFNARGSGLRGYDDTFQSIKDYFCAQFTSLDVLFLGCNSSSSSVYSQSSTKSAGVSVRIIKDATSLSNGQTGAYTGNDGKVYPTICIGTQEWVSCNLAETKYRDGSNIPTVTANSAWNALSSGAKCAYNNDESNV